MPYDRIRLIESEGQITPRVLKSVFLILCDENGNGFKGVADLEKVKRSGRAYL
jgi:hypothetical protein